MSTAELILRLTFVAVGLVTLVLGFLLKRKDSTLEVTPMVLIVIGALMIFGAGEGAV